jgi:hypothetical protein
MRLVSGMFSLGLVTATAGSLAAQVVGLPVRNAGIGTGVGIAADIGFPNAALGKGKALGITGSAGLGPIGFSATFGRISPKGAESYNSGGATLNIKVFGGPLVPVSLTLQTGAAYFGIKTGAGTQRYLHVPAGVGISVTIPNPVFSIKPWVAPRADMSLTKVPGVDLDFGKHFGISGGVDFGFLIGLSIRAMYDRVFTGVGADPSVFSIGLGFRVGT